MVSAGGFDAFVLGVTSAGNLLWSRRYGGSGDDFAWEAKADAANNVYVLGQFSSSVTFGGDTLVGDGGTDTFLAKMTTVGNNVWTKRFGGLAGENSYGLAIDPSGDIVIAGTFLQSIVFGNDAVGYLAAPRTRSW